MVQLMTNSTIAKQRLRLFGSWLIAPFFALGSGMITTVAVSAIGTIAALSLPWLIPTLAFVFLSESAISIYLFKDSVPETLVGVFIDGIFKDLSTRKKILLAAGIFSALGGGLALGALTYTSGVAACAAFLGVFAVSCPPVGMVLAAGLAVAGFIAYSSLLIKWIATAIKTDMHLKVKKFFKDIFTRDINKPLAQQVLEGFFKLTFTTSIFAISIIGTIATLGTMQKGLTQFLSLIPHADMLAIKIASSVISYGLMGMARLPWALQSVCSAFSTLGEYVGKSIYVAAHKFSIFCGFTKPRPIIANQAAMVEADANHPESGCKKMGVALLKTSAVLIHALSFGALARSGGGKVVTDLMGDMRVPLSATALDIAGQQISMTSGSMMAAGIGAFSIFGKMKKSQRNEEISANVVIDNRESSGSYQVLPGCSPLNRSSRSLST